jgi:hypothetical protein
MGSLHRPNVVAGSYLCLDCMWGWKKRIDCDYRYRHNVLGLHCGDRDWIC